MKNDPTIDFYRTASIQTALKLYEFSEDEKKVIQSAILASKKEKVDTKIGTFALLLSNH